MNRVADEGAWCAGCGRSLDKCPDPESCQPDDEVDELEKDEDDYVPTRVTGHDEYGVWE